jgi:hypothetical protein
VVAAAIEEGWTVEWTRNNHIRFKHPSGAMVHTSGTPSDHRAVKNLEAQLRRERRKKESE